MIPKAMREQNVQKVNKLLSIILFAFNVFIIIRINFLKIDCKDISIEKPPSMKIETELEMYATFCLNSYHGIITSIYPPEITIVVSHML